MSFWDWLEKQNGDVIFWLIVAAVIVLISVLEFLEKVSAR